MKNQLKFWAIPLMVTSVCHAQLYIQPNAVVAAAGNALITCKSSNFINKGIFEQSIGSTILFNGTINDTLVGVGTSPLSFQTIEVATSGSAMVVLGQPLDIASTILFTSGNINLNGNVISLQPNASLMGENETSHIIEEGALGGYVTITQSLNAPNAANPGNLGAEITSSQNLGSTTINRRHAGSVINGSTNVPTINKQYEILPTNDNGLNATLRCHYFDAELNGLSETDLIFIKSTASPYTTFTNQNYTTRSATANYVEKTGINDLSLWAITSATTPLPLTLLSFNGKCDDNMAILYWQTANERNISRYTIQQSIDAVKWAVIGELDAKNNVHDYEYRTENVGDYYRLCIFDQDGSYTYSNVLKVHCEQNNSDNLTIYPNPTRDNINLNINTATNSLMHVRVYTANGALAYSAEQQLQSGSQILTLPIENLATGNYLINASWGNGQYNKTFKLVKQ